MAAFNRPTEATYEVHEKVTIDTKDNEDHTFCGIMFPIKCKDLLPLDHLVIKSVAVRGRLGPLTVWVSNDEHHNRLDNGEESGIEQRVRLSKKYWTKLYEKEHPASRHSYKELVLESPIRLRPGQTRVLYIHSTLPGDEAIVYDNSYYGMTSKRFEDDKLAILTGRAHVSNDLFGQEPIWGWGNAWRDRREFVGRLEYGTVYKLWNPQVQPKFGSYFQEGARSLFLCQRRWESPLSMLPDECIFYILNMCRWDWFDDNSSSMKQRRRREKARITLEAETAKRQQEEAIAAATAAAFEMEADQKPPACELRCKAPVIAASASESEEQDDVECDDDDDDKEDEDEDDGADRMDEDWTEDSNQEEEEDGEDDNSDEEWSDDEDQYHRANVQAFSFRDLDSDDDEEDDQEVETAERTRRDWIRRQFARIHVLRALASMEDGEVAHVQQL